MRPKLALVSGMLLGISHVTNASGDACQAICQQVETFARQSRGDIGFVMELQRLSNACQSCQLRQRVRPYEPPPATAVPQWSPTPSVPADTPIIREYGRLNERVGNWAMRGQPLRKDIPLSSGVVQQEVYTPPPPSNYVDPFAAGRNAAPSSQSKPYNPGANSCPRGMRMRVSGSLSYCELDPTAN